MLRIGNSKLQHPNSKQIPSSKSQILNVLNLGFWSLDIVCDLVLICPPKLLPCRLLVGRRGRQVGAGGGFGASARGSGWGGKSEHPYCALQIGRASCRGRGEV